MPSCELASASFVKGDEYAAQIDQRFVRRGILLQRLAETQFGQREVPRLIGDGAQGVPCAGELRRKLHGMFQVLLGGIHVVLLQIVLRVHVVA
jgi:hypothetical protein